MFGSLSPVAVGRAHSALSLLAACAMVVSMRLARVSLTVGQRPTCPRVKLLPTERGAIAAPRKGGARELTHDLACAVGRGLR